MSHFLWYFFYLISHLLESYNIAGRNNESPSLCTFALGPQTGLVVLFLCMNDCLEARLTKLAPKKRIDSNLVMNRLAVGSVWQSMYLFGLTV